MEFEAFANGDLVSDPTEDVPACVGVRGYGHFCFRKGGGHAMEMMKRKLRRGEIMTWGRAGKTHVWHGCSFGAASPRLAMPPARHVVYYALSAIG